MNGALRLGEELMIYQAAEVWAELNARLAPDTGMPPAGDLIIDAQALTEIDGAGYQLLLLAARHWRAAGAQLRLRGLSDGLRQRLSSLNAAGELVLDTEGQP